MPNLYDLERIRDLDLAALERRSARRHDTVVPPGRAAVALRVARERVAVGLRTLAVRRAPTVREPRREVGVQDQLVVPAARS